MTDSITEMSVPSSNLEPTQLESLKQSYIFPESAHSLDVINFLENNPFLVPILLEARGQIHKYFPNSHLYLQSINDPEFDNPQLAVYIVRPENMNSEKLLDTLDRLEDDWWMDAEGRSQGKMFIGFD